MSHENWESTIFVGNLPMDIKEREIDDLFYKYGKITAIDIKTPRFPPAYAFVQFSDPRDADDACYYKDGVRFDGKPMRVKLSRPPRERRDGGYDDRDRDGDRGGSYSNDRKRGRDNYNDRDDYGHDSSRGPSGSGKKGKKYGYKIKIFNLPERASWQDLKDFARKCGHPTFAKVISSNDGVGVVEFEHEDTMLRAVDELDDTDFTTRDGVVQRVKVEKAEVEGEEGSNSNFKSSKNDDHVDKDDDERHNDDRHNDDRHNDDRHNDDRHNDDRDKEETTASDHVDTEPNAEESAEEQQDEEEQDDQN